MTFILQVLGANLVIAAFIIALHYAWGSYLLKYHREYLDESLDGYLDA